MNKQQIKSNATKKKIIETYLELYKTKDINKITIKEITDKSGYNRGTFYIYYRDVYDLHDKIKKELINEIKNHVNNLTKADHFDFKDIFSILISFYSKNEKYILPFILKDNDFQKNIKETMKPTLKQLLKKDINNNKYTDYLIEYHLASIFGIISYWIQNKKNITIDELFNLLKQIITKGVFTVMNEL